jgi:hypothetical protein
MLQSFMRMRHCALQWHVAQEKLFRLLDLPDSQPRGFVNLMLKKNRHVLKIHDYLAAIKNQK